MSPSEPPKYSMLSKADHTKASVVNVMAPVDGDGERGEMLDRARARQGTNVDSAQSDDATAELARARTSGVGIAADEVVTLERHVGPVEKMRRNRLEHAGEGNRRRKPRPDVFRRGPFSHL